MFKVVSMVRRIQTRLKRAQSPVRHRFKQYVCGRRLLRKQSFQMKDDEVAVHSKAWEELKDKSEAGLIAVFKDGKPYSFGKLDVALPKEEEVTYVVEPVEEPKVEEPAVEEVTLEAPVEVVEEVEPPPEKKKRGFGRKKKGK